MSSSMTFRVFLYIFLIYFVYPLFYIINFHIISFSYIHILELSSKCDYKKIIGKDIAFKEPSTTKILT